MEQNNRRQTSVSHIVIDLRTLPACSSGRGYHLCSGTIHVSVRQKCASQAIYFHPRYFVQYHQRTGCDRSLYGENRKDFLGGIVNETE
jgi:hypothetical protein